MDPEKSLITKLKYKHKDIYREVVDFKAAILGMDFEIDDCKAPLEINWFFDSCQSRLMIGDQGYDIQPAKVIFINSQIFDASADRIQLESGDFLYLIKISGGIIDFYTDKFLEFKLVFNSDLVLNKLDNAIGGLSHYICRTSLNFIFLHELGHLIQYSREPRIATNNSTERVGEVEKYNEEDHFLEFDADFFAVNKMTKYFDGFWDHVLNSELKSQGTFTRLVALNIFSFLIVHSNLMTLDDKRIYLNEHTHPHPYFRLYFILDCYEIEVKKYFFDDFIFDRTSIMSEIFNLIEFVKHHKMNYFNNDNFPLLVNKDIELINEYVAELRPKLQNIKYLNISNP